ncbi:PilW family protein [Patescibacteria group bacterium]
MKKIDLKNIKTKKGFTLVELLLYVSIASAMMFSLVAFAMMTVESNVKNQAVIDVEQQGVQIMQLVKQVIRNSEGINSPAQGVSSGTISMDVVNVGDDPTIFDVSSGVFRITEGVGSAIDITNSRVTVSGLSFYNLSRTDTPGVVRIQFTITHNNPEGRNEYDYSKTFYGTASLRQ